MQALEHRHTTCCTNCSFTLCISLEATEETSAVMMSRSQIKHRPHGETALCLTESEGSLTSWIPRVNNTQVSSLRSSQKVLLWVCSAPSPEGLIS